MQALSHSCTRCTVLCTVTEDAHVSSHGTTYGSDAYDEAATDWHSAVQAAGLPCPQLRVQFFPLQVQPVGGCGFLLPAQGTAHAAMPADLGRAAASITHPSLAVRPPVHRRLAITKVANLRPLLG